MLFEQSSFFNQLAGQDGNFQSHQKRWLVEGAIGAKGHFRGQHPEDPDSGWSLKKDKRKKKESTRQSELTKGRFFFYPVHN